MANNNDKSRYIDFLDSDSHGLSSGREIEVFYVDLGTSWGPIPRPIGSSCVTGSNSLMFTYPILHSLSDDGDK